jgi:hypothetical protein
MALAYANKADNKTAVLFTLSKQDMEKESSCGMRDENEGGMFDTAYVSLYEGESGEMHLKAQDPWYFLTDEYALSFSR